MAIFSEIGFKTWPFQRTALFLRYFTLFRKTIYLLCNEEQCGNTFVNHRKGVSKLNVGGNMETTVKPV